MTHSVTVKEVCQEGLDPCGSTEVYVHDHGHAWCVKCGSKKPVPDGHLPYGESVMEQILDERKLPGSSLDYLGHHTPKADATGEP